jgi:O-antigen ligase
LWVVITVVYLGVEGGGYDTPIWASAGLVFGWAALLGGLLGLTQARRPDRAGWVMLGMLGALAIWSAAGMIWTLSGERTLAAVARDLTYLLVLAFSIGALRARQARYLLSGVGTGIVVIALLALASRLHPGWFTANATNALLPAVRSRLSYPLNYWNALAELIALGIPLILGLAVQARSTVARALSSGALPMLGLTIALTLSRGGLVALALALLTFLILVPQRGQATMIAIVGGLGAALLTAVAFGDHDLHQGLNTAAATRQGTGLALLSAVVCLTAATFPFVLSTLVGSGATSSWRAPGGVARTVRAHRRSLAAVVVVLVAVVFVAAGGPHRVSHAWTVFKRPSVTNVTPGRLGELSGNGRYQFWSASLSALRSEPLRGIGAGTWEFWWTRHGDLAAGYAQNAHSLLFETLAETGLPGGALIVVFMLAALVGTIRRTIRAEPVERIWLAAAAAACVAFIVASLTDWVWQVPLLPVCFLMVVALALGSERPERRRRVGMMPRLAIVAGVLACLVVIAVPLETTLAIRGSQAAAGRGALRSALGYARTAERVEPYGASPWLQEALVLERGGDLGDAQRAALHAQSNEPSNWRIPVILARIDAELGETAAAVRASRRALLLNPSVELVAP